MAYEQKDNSGSLFINDRKDQDKHPDRTGNAIIGGVEYRVSGWIKDGAKGKWLSLAFTPKDAARTNDKARQEPARQPAPDLDDEIPF